MALDGNLGSTVHASSRSYWSAWATAIWGILIMAVFMLLQLITITVAALIVHPPANYSLEAIAKSVASVANNGTYLSLATLVTGILGPALILAIVRQRKGARVSDYLALKPFSVLSVIKWAFFLVVLLVLSDRLTRVLGRPEITNFDSNLFATAKPLWLFALGIAGGAPLFEEFFFRGFLFKGFENSFMKPIGALVVTSALFASTHIQYDLYGIVTIFAFGLLLGAARLSTGSIFVPMILHAASNGLFIVQAALLA